MSKINILLVGCLKGCLIDYREFIRCISVANIEFTQMFSSSKNIEESSSREHSFIPYIGYSHFKD